MRDSKAIRYLSDLLPDRQALGTLQLEDGDIVIHAPGFEDRTMAIASSLRSSENGHGILLKYLPHKADNRLHEVRNALQDLRIHVGNEDVLEYNRFMPGDFETRLGERIREHCSRRAIVDISTMSKLAIILVLHVCKKCDLPVRILYSEAEKYRPTEEEYLLAKERNEIHRPSLQVFTGLHRVVRVASIASVAMQGQPTAALVFMSFNNVLTQVLLNTVYPSRLFLINGRPPVHSWREAATAWIHEQVRHEWEDDNPVERDEFGNIVPVRAVSTLDYRETVSLLLDLYWELSMNHRILLAPAGSKLQAVGSYIVKALHPDIQIEYPSPEGFASSYSHGIGPRWLFDLGNIKDLLAKMSLAERREHLEIPI